MVFYSKNYTKNCVGQYFLDIEANCHPLHISFIKFTYERLHIFIIQNIKFQKCVSRCIMFEFFDLENVQYKPNNKFLISK